MSKLRWSYRVLVAQTPQVQGLLRLVIDHHEGNYSRSKPLQLVPGAVPSLVEASHSAMRRITTWTLVLLYGAPGSHRSGVSCLRAPLVPFVNVAVASASDPASTSTFRAARPQRRLGLRIPGATIRSTRTQVHFDFAQTKYGVVTRGRQRPRRRACVGISR